MSPKKRFSIWLPQALIMLLFFLFGLGAMGYSWVFFFLIALISFFSLFCTGRFQLSRQFLLVLFFSFFMFFFYCLNFGFALHQFLYFLLFPGAAFLIGEYISSPVSETKTQDHIIRDLLAIFYGFATRGFLSLIKTIYYYGFFPTDRQFTDIWSPYITTTAATAYQFTIFPLISVILPILFLSKKRISLANKIVCSIFSLLIFYIAVLLQSRTFFLAFFVLAFISPLLFTQKRSKNLKIFLVLFYSCCCGLMILLFAVSKDVTSFGNLLGRIPFLQRLISGGSNSERENLYAYFFNHCLKYFFGGMPTNVPVTPNSTQIFNYVHNFWLDTFKLCGFIPFALLIWITISCFALLLRLRNNEDKFFFLFLAYFLFGFLIFACFEPIYDVNPYFVMLFFILYGILTRVSPKKKPTISLSKQLSLPKKFTIAFVFSASRSENDSLASSASAFFGKRFVGVFYCSKNGGINKWQINKGRQATKEDTLLCYEQLRNTDVIISDKLPASTIKKIRKQNQFLMMISGRPFGRTLQSMWLITHWYDMFFYFRRLQNQYHFSVLAQDSFVSSQFASAELNKITVFECQTESKKFFSYRDCLLLMSFLSRLPESAETASAGFAIQKPTPAYFDFS